MKKIVLILCFVVLWGFIIFPSSGFPFFPPMASFPILWSVSDSDSNGTYFTGLLTLTYDSAIPKISHYSSGYHSYRINGNSIALTLFVHDKKDIYFSYAGEVSVTAYGADGLSIGGPGWRFAASTIKYGPHTYNVPANAAKVHIDVNIYKDDIWEWPWEPDGDKTDAFNYRCDLYIDNEGPVITPNYSPELPAYPELKNIDNNWFKHDGIFYCKEDIVVSATFKDRAGGGINSGLVSLTSSQTNGAVRYTAGNSVTFFSEEMQHRATFKASDDLGNPSSKDLYLDTKIPGSNSYFIDKSAPDLPDSLNVRYTANKRPDGFHDIDTIKINWSEAVDNPANHNSGLGHYYYYFGSYGSVREKTNVTYLDLPNPDPFNNEGVEILDNLTTEKNYSNNSAIEPGNIYSIGVTPADNLYNVLHIPPGSNGPFYCWKVSDLYVPPDDIVIEQVVYETPVIEEINPGDFVAVYPVDITLNKDERLLEFIDQLNIYYYEDDLSGNPPSRDDYFHLNAGYNEVGANLTIITGEAEGPHWVVDEDRLRFRAYLKASVGAKDQHAHKQYGFFTAVVHKHHYIDEADNEMDVETRGLDYNGKPRVSNLLHYKMDLVTQQSGNPGYFLTIESDGSVAGTGGDIARIRTSEPVTFRFNGDSVQPVELTGGWKDYEEDNLSFMLRTINGHTLFEGDVSTPGDNNEFSLEYNQTVHCYLEIMEKAGGVGDVHSNKTTRDVDDKMTGIYITFSDIAPSGSFSLVPDNVDENTTGIIPVYTEDRPANDRSVRLCVDPSDFSRDVAVIEVWNLVVPEDTVSPTEWTGAEFEALPKADFNSFQMPVDGAGYFNWTLSEEGSEYKVVVMHIIDGGTDKYIYRVTRLDMDPGSPVEGLSCRVEGYEMILDWPSADGAEGYLVQYRAEGETVFRQFNCDIPNAAIGFDPFVNPGDFNKKIEIRIVAVDIAGNEAASAIFKVFSPAYAGVTGDVGITQGFDLIEDSEDFNRYVTWEIPGGIAERYDVDVFPPGSTSVVTHNTVSGTSFKVSGLDSGGDYSFDIYPINKNNDASTCVTFTYTMENYPPSPPQVTGPTDWVNGKKIEFGWNPSLDADETGLEYTIFIMQEGDEDFIPMATTTGHSYSYGSGVPALNPGFPADFFTGGAHYSWKLFVSDGTGAVNGTAEGAVRSFVVDEQEVSINFPGLPASYSSQKFLAVEIHTGQSGLVEGETRYSLHGNDISKAGYVEMEDLGNGVFSGEVPLVDGIASSYDIEITTVNGAGTPGTGNKTGLLIDHTGPFPGQVVPGVPQGYRVFHASPGEVNTVIEYSDRLSGVREIDYAFILKADDPVDNYNTILLEGAAGHSTNKYGFSEQRLFLEGKHGEACYLALRLRDWVGNESIGGHTDGFHVLEKPFLIDATPAAVSFSLPGHNIFNGCGYFINAANLQPVLESEDPDSGIHDILYSLDRAGGSGGPWYDTWDELTVNENGLEEGAGYVFTARVINGAGVSADTDSIVMVYDPTPPLNLSLDYASGSGYAAGEEVRIRAHAEENGSEIAMYRLAVGSPSDNTLVSSNITGNNGGWLEQDTALFDFVLPDMTGGYVVYYEAVNASGLCARDVIEYSLYITNEPERIVVTGIGPYQGEADRLTASWMYTGNERISGYQYRVNGPGYEDTAWLPESGYVNITGATVEGLQLVNGAGYRMEVRAAYENIAGVITGMSRGVIIDTTAPVFMEENGLVTPEACHANNFNISWQVNEEESEIASVEVQLEIPGEEGRLTDAGGWIKLKTAARGEATLGVNAEGEAPDFENGERIHLTMRITNTADRAAVKHSRVIYYDNSPPPVPVVADQGESIRGTQVDELGLDFNWVWTENDPESGKPEYRWGVYIATGTIDMAALIEDRGFPGTIPWTDAGEKKEITWTDTGLQDGESCYFLVKAVNRAGLVSIGCSDGITVDETAPLISSLKLTESPDPGSEEVQYIGDTAGLYLHIEATDLGSGIDGYKAWYGPSGGDINLGEYESPDTPILLEKNPGEYPVFNDGELIIFMGDCVDNVNLETVEKGYTKGVKLDTGKPVVEKMTGLQRDGGFYFEWDITTSIAPVEYYEYTLLRVPYNGGGYTDETVINEWTSRDTAGWYEAGERDILINRELYNNGPGRHEENSINTGYYILRVRAVSASGIISETGESNMLVIDETKPLAAVTLSTADDRTRYAGKWVKIKIEASDEPAPGEIITYQYRIGTERERGCFSNGWVSFSTKEINPELIYEFACPPAGGTVPQHGDVLLVEARVWDSSDLVSENAAAEPVIYISEGAGVSGVTVPGRYINTQGSVSGTSFTITDNDSGIVKYMTKILPDTQPGTFESALEDMNSWHLYYPETIPAPVVEQTGFLITTPDDFEDGETFVIAVIAENAAGILSEPGYSAVVTYDGEDPVITFGNGDEEFYNAESNSYVFNPSSFTLHYEVTDNISPLIIVELYLRNTVGAIVSEGSGDFLNFAGEEIRSGVEQEMSYGAPDDEYGMYYLLATLYDEAGNISYSEIPLRYNAPPVINSFDFDPFTTPGNLLTLSVIPEDPDDEKQVFEYRWSIPGYEEEFPEFKETKETANPVIRLPHKNPLDQVSVYDFELVVIDGDGKASGSFPTQVTVLNTVQGDLYEDEYWNPVGIHELAGEINVGHDITLTIATGVELEMKHNFEGAQYHINIHPGGTLIIEDGASLGVSGTGGHLYWGGLYIEGNAAITGAFITNAEQGTTITSESTVQLTGTTYDGNQTGIHVLKEGQRITYCRVRNSYYYGVKEDNGATPVLSGCTLENNFIDYYDGEKGKLTDSELAELQTGGD